MVSLALIISVVVLTELAELGLNRHTTIEVGWPAYAVVLVVSLVLATGLFLASLANDQGEVNWLVTRDSTVLDRRLRITRVLRLLILLIGFDVWWSWYATGIAAQFLGGEPGSIPGTVIRVEHHVSRRLSCRLELMIRSDGGADLYVCHQAGPFDSTATLSPTVPAEGQHVVVVTKANWAGVVAQRLVF